MRRLKQHIPGCMGVQPSSVTRACAMGCDVRPGSWDVAIAEPWKIKDQDMVMAKLVFYGKVQDEEDVMFLAQQYPVSCGVMDSRPDGSLIQRTVRQLNKMGKDFWRAQYNTNPSNIERVTNEKEKLVTLNRSMTMDNVLHAFISGLGMALPQNYKYIHKGRSDEYGDFVSELLTPTRVTKDASKGEDGLVDWTKGEDHAYHAINYLLAAIAIGKFNLPRGRVMMPMLGAVAGTLSDSFDDDDDPAYAASKDGVFGDDNDDSLGPLTLEF